MAVNMTKQIEKKNQIESTTKKRVRIKQFDNNKLSFYLC